MKSKFQDVWSHHSYIVYVVEGRKIWHTAHGSYDLHKGDCVFVNKGASIVEQFFDVRFCLIVFFVPDEFICAVLKTRTSPVVKSAKKYEPIISIHTSAKLEGFFHSMIPYFNSGHETDETLLELKFRELILTIADNSGDSEILSYFCSLIKEPQSVTLQRVMEENFCFNLKMEEYAKISNRSLSAFKRDFQKQFNTTPGKWLLQKRLRHALHLLTNVGKTVSEAAFESGFENPSHFSRSFRGHFGVPPTAMKQQISA
jgi:AraC family transcriptional regulator, exoenzyme S synthesis regulatory protein ExsA